MKQWKKLIWPSIAGVWTVLMVSQIVLSFFLYNRAGIEVVEYIGWAALAVSGVFGWMPIFILRRKGGVPKSNSLLSSCVLLNYLGSHSV